MTTLVRNNHLRHIRQLPELIPVLGSVHAWTAVQADQHRASVKPVVVDDPAAPGDIQEDLNAIDRYAHALARASRRV